MPDRMQQYSILLIFVQCNLFIHSILFSSNLFLFIKFLYNLCFYSIFVFIQSLFLFNLDQRTSFYSFNALLRLEPFELNYNLKTMFTLYRIAFHAGIKIYPIQCVHFLEHFVCLLYTSPSPRDKRQSRMPSSA